MILRLWCGDGFDIIPIRKVIELKIKRIQIEIFLNIIKKIKI